MLIPFMATALLAVPTPQPATSTLATTKSALVDHGKLTWFDGSYEEALKSAAESKKLIFMDFWTDW